MKRSGLTVLEVVVAAAVACWLYLAIDAHLDQQSAMTRLMEAKLAARQVATRAARAVLANPVAAPPSPPDYRVTVQPLGSAGAPGVSRVRVTATRHTVSDSVEVVVRE